MDVVFYAGLDDTQLNAKLARAQKGIVKTLGGIPGQLGGAASLASMIPAVGGIAGAFIAVGGAVLAYNQRLEDAAEAARVAGIEAVRAAREAGRAWNAAIVGGSISAFGSDDEQKRAAILKTIDDIRAANEARIQKEFEAAKANRTEYDVYVERQKVEESIQQIRQKMLGDQERESELNAVANIARLRAAAFTAQNADAEASVVDELQKHAVEQEKIARLARDQPALAREAEAAETARHAAAMEKIRAEELGRQAGLESQATKAADEKDAQTLKARMLDLELQKQEALVANDKERADAVQKQIELEKRLAEIMALDIPDAQKQALADRARALVSAADEPQRGNATRSAGVGFINQNALSIAALGGGPALQLQREQVLLQKTTNTKLDQVIQAVKNQAGAATYA